MRLEFQPAPHVLGRDAQLLEREFDEPEFQHLRGLFQATRKIRDAERLIAQGICPAEVQTQEDGTTVHREVTTDTLRRWKILHFGMYSQLQKDGLVDVAQAVIRRAYAAAAENPQPNCESET